MIEHHPDYVKLRFRLGDWEADTITSRQSKAAVMVLANRKARLIILKKLIGIVRRFYPKKTDWNNVCKWDLNKVMRFANNRPMKCLGFKTSSQVVALKA